MPVISVAVVQPTEGRTKLLGHQVVNHRVDGTVGIYADPAEEQEPGVQVRRAHEGVNEHQGSVRHPQQGEQHDHHCKHLGDLRRRVVKNTKLSV